MLRLRRGIGVEGVASEIGALGRAAVTVNRTKLVERLQRRFRASAEEAESAIQQAKDVNVVTEAGNLVSLVMAFDFATTRAQFPYEVQPLDKDVVVTFTQHVDHERTPEYDHDLENLVERHELVICDISKSSKVTSDWLRFFLRLSIKARKMGKRVAIIGMRDNVKEVSNMLGLLDDLQLYHNFEEARRLVDLTG